MTNLILDIKCTEDLTIQDIVNTILQFNQNNGDTITPRPFSHLDAFMHKLPSGSGYPNLRYNFDKCIFSYEDFKRVIDSIMVCTRNAPEILINIENDEPFFGADEIKYIVKSALSLFNHCINGTAQLMSVITQVQNSIISSSEMEQMLKGCNIPLGIQVSGNVPNIRFNVNSDMSSSDCITDKVRVSGWSDVPGAFILGGISLAATGFMLYKYYIHPKVFKKHDVAPSTSVDEHVLTEILGSENSFQHIDEGL